MPKWIYDPDWNGVVLDNGHNHLCHCNRLVRRHVAFEGKTTGRRFLGYNYEKPQCSYLGWIDPPHRKAFERALVKTWKNATAECSGLEDQQRQEVVEAEKQKVGASLREIQSVCLSASRSLRALVGNH